ncbi:hypothetical protein SAMN04487969_114153 [Paenibacillus algorifonticola]|uniref:Uncharacterized protein n=1 Tax=Paenibacillus algorifonticola TaxID=684063 RepID=A0A1I2G6N6_9BACL|nr:hypothetical protein [Paenibacillus algorifonticola]SFF12281.1 hypothetical protein SAMN04487969_114153 [Paenibacillus algorifonticola]
MNQIKKEIYVKVTSMNYWWGVYGLDDLTGWEDIILYEKKDEQYNRLGSTCICTRVYLESAVKDLKKDRSEKAFVEKINKCLLGNSISYHYYYDKTGDEDFYELPFNNLPLNEKGVKPRSFEMWHPDERINEETIRQCVVEFCSRFLNIEPLSIHFYEAVAFEEARASFEMEQERWGSMKKIVFSDGAVSQLVQKASKPRNKILAMLKNSLRSK